MSEATEPFDDDLCAECQCPVLDEHTKECSRAPYNAGYAAGRLAGIDAAARMCDGYLVDYATLPTTAGFSETCRLCAAAIRALAPNSADGARRG